MKCVMNLAMSLQRREGLSTQSLLKPGNKSSQTCTHFIPLRCMIHSTMVAFTQNRMKKSTVSARNLCRGEGMVYSRPTKGTKRTEEVMSLGCMHRSAAEEPELMRSLQQLKKNSVHPNCASLNLLHFHYVFSNLNRAIIEFYNVKIFLLILLNLP